MIIFVISAAEFVVVEEAIRLYERASGARLNPRKSKALTVGSWCTWVTVLGIAYYTHVTILGVTFWGTIEQTMEDSWARLTEKADKLSLHSGPLSGSTDALCQNFSPVQNLVYRLNPSGSKHIHTTNDNRHYIVYLERNSLPSACINTTTTKTNGKMGDAGY